MEANIRCSEGSNKLNFDWQFIVTLIGIVSLGAALYFPITRNVAGVEKRLTDDAREREGRLIADARERESRLTAEIKAVESRLTAEIKAVESRLDRRLQSLENKTDTLTKDVGEVNGAVGVLIADRQREPVETA